MSQEDGRSGITPPYEFYSMSPVKNAVGYINYTAFLLIQDMTLYRWICFGSDFRK